MDLSPAAVLIAGAAVAGGVLALGGFIWAVRHGQFSPSDLHEGGDLVLDEGELQHMAPKAKPPQGESPRI